MYGLIDDIQELKQQLAESQAERDLLAEALQWLVDDWHRNSEGGWLTDDASGYECCECGASAPTKEQVQHDECSQYYHDLAEKALSAPPIAQRLAAMQELREAAEELRRVETVINRVDDPKIDRGPYQLHDWLAQILQVLVMDRGTSERKAGSK